MAKEGSAWINEEERFSHFNPKSLFTLKEIEALRDLAREKIKQDSEEQEKYPPCEKCAVHLNYPDTFVAGVNYSTRNPSHCTPTIGYSPFRYHQVPLSLRYLRLQEEKIK